MAKIENLLQAIECGDGKTVRDFMIAFPFETQLTIARRLQTLNLRHRVNKVDSPSGLAPTIYAQFEIIDSPSGTQEMLTVRVVQGGNAEDIYSVQRHSDTGRLLVRYHCQTKPTKRHLNDQPISLSRIEVLNCAPGGNPYAFNPGPDGFGVLTALNMVG